MSEAEQSQVVSCGGGVAYPLAEPVHAGDVGIASVAAAGNKLDNGALRLEGDLQELDRRTPRHGQHRIVDTHSAARVFLHTTKVSSEIKNGRGAGARAECGRQEGDTLASCHLAPGEVGKDGRLEARGLFWARQLVEYLHIGIEPHDHRLLGSHHETCKPPNNQRSTTTIDGRA